MRHDNPLDSVVIQFGLSAFADRISFPSSDITLSPDRIKTELLSGLTVALALVPEAVAFAFVAGVHPLVGLYAAFIVGLMTSVVNASTIGATLTVPVTFTRLTLFFLKVGSILFGSGYVLLAFLRAELP